MLVQSGLVGQGIWYRQTCYSYPAGGGGSACSGHCLRVKAKAKPSKAFPPWSCTMSQSTPFEAFERHTVSVESEALGPLSISVRKAGSNDGKPVLLLHGYPQSSYLWNKVAPELSTRYTIIAPDLRGYGLSSKPPGSGSHVEYSKREMAKDMVLVMKHFGFDRFDLVAHDRGARVAHRLVLDHPGIVDNLMVLDITPTLDMYEKTNMTFAAGYWHWFFLIQAAPEPENVINADPSAFWKLLTRKASHANMAWSENDLDEYQRYFFQPETVHATCEDYRAAATIDLVHDRQDREQGNKVSVQKLRVLWGSKGMIEVMGNALETWKAYSADSVEVSGRSLDCGHYIPEEQPQALLEEIFAFLG
ncbi:alpha/beta hydrolase [Papiliotrema laurentii]|uniref:Alpha/beta hydrolase n=1 Tax=Papiliotrema laurentii TaxID=5418 RepID=A0AAD9FTU0_PAPLA|nr:alpha/beta hydrolase [Papiliotrema laurentii]